jgi:membrane protein implicated in regulation of membrane protease activity
LASPDGDGNAHGIDHNHGSSWLFGVLSFRALVAAATFFGLAGMAANTAATSIANQLLIAIGSGGAALFGVHWLMQSFYHLGQSGTLRINRTIGKAARVNISIPGGNAGQGKVQLKVQGRLTELAAVTSAAEKLPTGSQVVVIGVTRGNILEVEPLPPTGETTRGT